MCKQRFARLRTTRTSESPAQVCGKVNSLLHENIATGKFVTFLYGILDGETRTFQYSNAGHLYPILVSAGSIRMLEKGGSAGRFPSLDIRGLDDRDEDRGPFAPVH
jgi:serine phosphatase RsbU (regulator of sigma subunit)